MADMRQPQMMHRRWIKWGRPPYKQTRCSLCYRRFWPWQERIRGANYFPHPYMTVHPICGKVYLRALGKDYRAEVQDA
jgi:hypothetical protein